MQIGRSERVAGRGRLMTGAPDRGGVVKRICMMRASGDWRPHAGPESSNARSTNADCPVRRAGASMIDGAEHRVPIGRSASPSRNAEFVIVVGDLDRTRCCDQTKTLCDILDRKRLNRFYRVANKHCRWMTKIGVSELVSAHFSHVVVVRHFARHDHNRSVACGVQFDSTFICGREKEPFGSLGILVSMPSNDHLHNDRSDK